MLLEILLGVGLMIAAPFIAVLSVAGPLWLVFRAFGNRTDDFVPKNDTRPITLGSED